MRKAGKEVYPMKLRPALKDYIWGGEKLKNEYGIKSDLDRVAEAWMLSCHKDGASVVENGEYAGLTLAEALEKAGPSALGKRGASFRFFPMLIKLIDAKRDLSIQVHPSDEYALKEEHEYGKTEMWYVVDCDEGACLYYGFSREISKEEFRRRIEENTLLEVLNRVPVRKGDCFFIKSGTIHAIGAGLLIAEIQQNSNTTYRVYDYGRLGADGKPRELHIEKAMAVTECRPPESPVLHTENSGDIAIAECEYFTVKKLDVNGSAETDIDGDSFSSLLCLDGAASVGGVDIKKGECVFLPAGIGRVKITGNARFIESRV